MKKKHFHSLYLKWIILFTGLIITAQGFSLLFALRFILPDLQANVSEKLYRKAVFIQNMHRNGMTISEETLTLTGDTDINFYLFDVYNIPDEVGRSYKNIISLDMLMRAADGEIVSSYMAGSLKMPYCLMALDDNIALLTPNYLNNDLSFFAQLYQRSLFSSSMIAAVLIVSALVVVIRPIRKVSEATRIVAGGDFNVIIKTRGHDEIAELVQNFNIMTQALQKNEYLKKDFVSNVSHEFKTPITSIAGFARLMKNAEATPNELNDYADVIIRESDRLSGLSANLLELSLLDSDTFVPPKNDFLLDEQIREAILLLQNKWEEKRIEFDIQMDELPYNGSESLLLRVWLNLLDNAVKFSPANGIVTIAARRDPQGMTVTVSDQGPGITVEQAKRIFDRFYKVDPSRAKEGSGLGLSIVKHILSSVGGTISVGAATDGGACFTVTLPG